MFNYPVLDVKVTLFDGSFHDVDSSEMAFKIAGSMGFKKGASEASPVLLEPTMKVEVTTPEDWMGDVVGDLVSLGVEAFAPLFCLLQPLLRDPQPPGHEG